MDAEQDAEAQAMLRVAAGDRAAFAWLYDRHHAAVARFALRFVGDRARAEELAQDVWVKLYRSAGGYRPEARFRTYLFRVATHHCLNEVRRTEYRVAHEPLEETDGGAGALPAPGAEGPEAQVAGRELERAVGAALGRMSERERAAFSLCRFEGMAYRDIAEVLGASESAVKSLIHRATVAVARAVAELEAGGPQAGAPEARSRA